MLTVNISFKLTILINLLQISYEIFKSKVQKPATVNFNEQLIQAGSVIIHKIDDQEVSIKSRASIENRI